MKRTLDYHNNSNKLKNKENKNIIEESKTLDIPENSSIDDKDLDAYNVGCCGKCKNSKPIPIIEESLNDVDDDVTENKTDNSSKSDSDSSLYNKHNICDLVKEINRKCSQTNPTRRALSNDLASRLSGLITHNKIKFENILKMQLQNPEMNTPYVLDAESYDVYKEFYSKIISYTQNGIQTHDLSLGLDFGQIEKHRNLDLNEDKEQLRVMYCEMITRRNLHEYELNGCIEQTNRNAVKDYFKTKLREVFSSLSTITIPNEWQSRLMEEERFLFSTSIMKNFPTGRVNMIYRDENDAALGAIINYDDHLQIVASTNSGNIGHIFYQVSQIMNSTEFHDINFLRHKKFGFITVNPNYIGSGFTIRLHLKVNYVSCLDDVESLYLSDLGLTIRQHRSEKRGIMVLSNSRTMQLTEYNIFSNIIEGFKRLYELDLELEHVSPLAYNDDVMPVESLNKLAQKINNSDSKTYTVKYLTDNIVSQYNGISTNFNGLINYCIRGNAFHPHSLFPKACDPDCYSTFSRFFNPILLEANNHRQFMHNSFPNYKIAANEPRFAFYHPLITGFRVRFSRNIEDFAFPMLTSTIEREKIEKRILNCLNNLPEQLQGKYIPLSQIKLVPEYEFLNKYNIIPKSRNAVKRSNYVYRNWPKNRGIYLIKKDPNYPNNVLYILINEDDHLQVVCLNYCGQRIDLCYDRAVRLMRYLDKYFDGQFSKKLNYGFLSSNPQNVGCCMRVSAKMKLKHLGHDRVSFNEFCIANLLNYRGLKGSGSKSENHVYDISLKLNLNYSEYQILMLFTQRIKELILEERSYDYSISRPLYANKRESIIQNNDLNDGYSTVIERSRLSINTTRKVSESSLETELKQPELIEIKDTKIRSISIVKDRSRLSKISEGLKLDDLKKVVPADKKDEPVPETADYIHQIFDNTRSRSEIEIDEKDAYFEELNEELMTGDNNY